jgi:hypothetical protein
MKLSPSIIKTLDKLYISLSVVVLFLVWWNIDWQEVKEPVSPNINQPQIEEILKDEFETTDSSDRLGNSGLTDAQKKKLDDSIKQDEHRFSREQSGPRFVPYKRPPVWRQYFNNIARYLIFLSTALLVLFLIRKWIIWLFNHKSDSKHAE